MTDAPALDPGPLQHALTRATRLVEMVLYPTSERTDLGRQLERFARAVCSASHQRVALRVAPASSEPSDAPLLARPALALRRGPTEPIRYLAVPAGPEWLPFVETLGQLATSVATVEDASAPGPHDAAQLATPNASPAHSAAGPAQLLVLMADACPHCPHAVRAACKVALTRNDTLVHIVDVERHPDVGARFNARTVPTTIIDDGLTLTRVVSASQLARLLGARGTPEYADQLFASLVEGGRLQAAAERLCSDAGSTLLHHAWQQSTTNTRVGLLLAAESALEQKPHCLDAATALVAESLADDDVALVGDTVDLLGRIGNRAAMGAVRRLLDHPNADVVEIALDVLATLDG